MYIKSIKKKTDYKSNTIHSLRRKGIVCQVSISIFESHQLSID